MRREQSYSSLISEEKQLSISLSKIRNEKKEMKKAYKNCLSQEEKFLFIMEHLITATYEEFLDNLLYLDTNIVYDDAKIFVEINSQKLLDMSKIGLIKTKNKYGFYILNI